MGVRYGLIISEEYRLKLSGDEVLRIFGPKGEEVREERR
jgi:hypothetical protein